MYVLKRGSNNIFKYFIRRLVYVKNTIINDGNYFQVKKNNKYLTTDGRSSEDRKYFTFH